MNQDSYLCHEHSLLKNNNQNLSSKNIISREKWSKKKKKKDNNYDKSIHSSLNNKVSSFYDGGKIYTYNDKSFIQNSIGYEHTDHEKMIYCWAVFDGHDLLGEYASSKARESFDNYISSLYSNKLNDSEIRKAFFNVHRDIIKIYNNCPKQCFYISPNKSKLTEYKHILKSNEHYYTSNNIERPLEFGTTALICILIKETMELIISWVGDSQVKIVSYDENYGEFYLETLMDIHSYRNNKEISRIKSLKLDGVKINDDGFFISLNNKSMHHISLTRALGHKKFSEYGITPEPQIKRMKLDRNHQYLVIGTDGKNILIYFIRIIN